MSDAGQGAEDRASEGYPMTDSEGREVVAVVSQELRDFKEQVMLLIEELRPMISRVAEHEHRINSIEQQCARREFAVDMVRNHEHRITTIEAVGKWAIGILTAVITAITTKLFKGG